MTIPEAQRVSHSVSLSDGRRIDLNIRRSGRARRISLQMSDIDGSVELVLPSRAAVADALDFARTQVGWIERRLKRVRSAVPFTDGAVVPHLGTSLRIHHTDAGVGGVRRANDLLMVQGRSEDIPTRIHRWFRDQAAREIGWRVGAKTNIVGRRCNRVTIRDPRTRWGSCSQLGNLNFSWRLIMAPEHVLDYVVAHEVAHLVEMNHGPRFWAHVAELCEQPADARSWLRRHAAELHRYG